MRSWAIAGLAAAAFMLVSAAGKDALVVSGDGIVSGRINDAPLRLMIDPSATATPLVTRDAARRGGLKAGPFDFEYRIGPTRITGDSAVGRIDVGTGPDKRRIAFTDRPWHAGVEGVIGPGMLPQAVVRFQLRAARAGEKSNTFPLLDQGGIEGKWGERFAAVTLGGRTLRIQFDPRAETTLATAQAGALIADQLGGRFGGGTRRVPIAFGVDRPVRRLTLDRPLSVGPLALGAIDVRTGDFGSAAGIREADADPSEIVVVGRTKINPAYDQVKLGRDALDRCSSIVFDRRAKTVTLRCI